MFSLAKVTCSQNYLLLKSIVLFCLQVCLTGLIVGGSMKREQFPLESVMICCGPIYCLNSNLWVQSLNASALKTVTLGLMAGLINSNLMAVMVDLRLKMVVSSGAAHPSSPTRGNILNRALVESQSDFCQALCVSLYVNYEFTYLKFIVGIAKIRSCGDLH